MTSKRFYYEDLVIYLHKGGLTYLVDMVDRGFFIERDLTEMLASENKENPYLMAVLLAYIKDARKSGNEGVIIGEQDDPPTSTELLTSISSLLEEYHIEQITSAAVCEIFSDGVNYKNAADKSDETIYEARGFDTVVLSMGFSSRYTHREGQDVVYDFANELKEIVPEVHVVGDAVRARRALEATREAYDAAMQL